MENFNFETACEYLKIDSSIKPDVLSLIELSTKTKNHVHTLRAESILAFYELSVIVEAMNQLQNGDIPWVDYWENENVNKYCVWPEIEIKNGIHEFICKKIHYSSVSTGNYIWSKIIFKSPQDAEFALIRYRDLFKKIYMINF